jgi:hypothetical protein
MADLATLQTRLDEIDEILAGGVKSTTIGDRRVDYDLVALEKERNRIERQIAGMQGTKPSVRRGRYNPYYSSNGY